MSEIQNNEPRGAKMLTMHAAIRPVVIIRESFA